jgi:hypothetical protein
VVHAGGRDNSQETWSASVRVSRCGGLSRPGTNTVTIPVPKRIVLVTGGIEPNTDEKSAMFRLNLRVLVEQRKGTNMDEDIDGRRHNWVEACLPTFAP